MDKEFLEELLNKFSLKYELTGKELKSYIYFEEDRQLLNKVIVSNSFKVKLINSVIDFEQESLMEFIGYVKGTLMQVIEADEEELEELIFSSIGNIIKNSKESLFKAFPLLNKEVYYEVLKESENV